MKNKIFVLVILLVTAGAYVWIHTQSATSSSHTQSQFPPYATATYTIEHTPVALVDGYASSPIAPGSASTLTTRYFGNDAIGNLTGTHTHDAVFILSQSGSGSGTFYYVVAALSTPDGYRGTNGVFLGDRIAPQTTRIQNGEIIVNYADRKPTDPMSTQPSVGVTKYLRVQNGELVEVGQ